MAIAVDNLADADSLTTIDKEDEEQKPKSRSPTPILEDDDEDLMGDEFCDVEEGNMSERDDETVSDTKIHLDDDEEEYDDDDGKKIFFFYFGPIFFFFCFFKLAKFTHTHTHTHLNKIKKNLLKN